MSSQLLCDTKDRCLYVGNMQTNIDIIKVALRAFSADKSREKRLNFNMSDSYIFKLGTVNSLFIQCRAVDPVICSAYCSSEWFYGYLQQ